MKNYRYISLKVPVETIEFSKLECGTEMTVVSRNLETGEVEVYLNTIGVNHLPAKEKEKVLVREQKKINKLTTERKPK